MQQLTTQGITGRHQPRQAAPRPSTSGEDGEPPLDPRYAPAQDALERNDFDGAVAEYQKLLNANPADAEAAAGLAMAKLLQRTERRRRDGRPRGRGRRPRRRRRPDPGRRPRHARRRRRRRLHRLVDAGPRTTGDERNQAREHLLGLFAAVGNDDPRVLKGRQALATALF